VEFILISLLLFVASMEVRLEVNCEKTKNLLMSREQDSGQNHNINVANPMKVWHSSNIGNSVRNFNLNFLTFLKSTIKTISRI